MKGRIFKNIAAAFAVATATALVSGCGMRTPHFAIIPKSQGVLSSNVANNKVDILWVIDNSGSMGPKQQNLSNSINSFMSQFVTKNFDYHIGVTTTDIRPTDPTYPDDPNYSGQHGCLVGSPKIITPDTPDPVDALASNALVGYYGSSDAHSFDAVQMALSSPNSDSTGCNAGFLRPDAFLAVIFFSDANDDTSATVSGLLSFLDSVKAPIATPNGGTVRSYFTSGMVVDDLTDPDCIALGPFSELGTKFIEAADDTDGTIASICHPDFSQGLLDVGNHILEATTAIRLAQVPDVTTLQVIEGDATVVPEDATNGWTFDAPTNRVIFHGSYIPSQPGILLTVNYTPADIVR